MSRDRSALAAFVAAHFAEAGSDVEPWIPDDVVDAPRRLLARVADPRPVTCTVFTRLSSG